MSTAAIVTLCILIFVGAAHAGHALGKDREHRAWRTVLRGLRDECADGTTGDNDRATLDAVYWRRRIRDDL